MFGHQVERIQVQQASILKGNGTVRTNIPNSTEDGKPCEPFPFTTTTSGAATSSTTTTSARGARSPAQSYSPSANNNFYGTDERSIRHPQVYPSNLTTLHRTPSFEQWCCLRQQVYQQEQVEQELDKLEVLRGLDNPRS